MNESPPPTFSPTTPTNTMAIVSLVSGIASWVALPLLGAIVAIVTGHMARGEIKRNAEVQGGDGLAVVGLVLGYLNLAVSCLVPLLIFGGVIGIGGLAGLCAALSDPSSLGAFLQ